jgi:hypothetical protein
MFLRELFSPLAKFIICEGGNLVIGDVEANKIDTSQRAQVVPILDNALTAINNAYAAAHENKGIWSPKLLASKKFLAGSSFHFFNRTGISDEIFTQVKRTVGDIDTMIDANKRDSIISWLSSLPQGAVVGPARFVGYDDKDPVQILTMWQFPDIVIQNNEGKQFPINIQVDLEMKEFEKDEPTTWSQFSTSSSWEDISVGIKGVFHKFLIQSMTGLTAKDFILRKLVGRGKARAPQDVPTRDNMYSFAIKSKEGGGLRPKYDPVIDPSTGRQEMVDGLPVFEPRATTGYEKDLGKIFQTIFGSRMKPKQLEAEKEKFWSFVGILSLMKQYLTPEESNEVVNSFLEKLFAPGAQGLYANDKEKDHQEKSAAVDKMFDILEMSPPQGLDQMKQQYYSSYKLRNVNEAEEVVQSKRKSIVHLEKMKDIDFLDLLDELRDESNGKLTLDNIPMTVKIDGFGSRFGKSEDGRPYYETSRTGPKFGPGNFLKYHQEKGTQDPEILRRAGLFDELQNKIMNVIANVDKRLGENFLKDIKIHVEVLYLPFASEQEDGRLKFVGISYDKLPDGVELALVPLFAEISSSGATHPKSTQIIKTIKNLGQIDDTMFIDNSLTTDGSIDVTGSIPPMENLETLRNMILSNKRDAKKEAAEALQPVKDELANYIIEHPGILGKDILGRDYEGIILNSKQGPIKITSKEQKDIIKAKNDAIKAARPPEADPNKSKSGKTAVVTIGSFVGHVGHQQLANLVFDKAKELGADPYVYISSMTGPDDPIPPEVKFETWQRLYPDQREVFSLIQPGGTPVKKIEKELVTVSNPPPYDKIIVMVGDDRYEGMRKWMQHLSKRMKNPQYPGFEHVEFDVIRTPRSAEEGGTGMSFTELRNVLKDTGKTSQEQFTAWRKAFDPSLDDKWIKYLITVARKGMGIQPPKKDLKESVMSEIDYQIGNKLDKAIALYRKKRINDEVLGDFTIKLAGNVARKLDLDQDAVQGVINDYVDNALSDLDEEAVGVGIITKQNTTADVKPNTLGKMLRSFKLA